MYVLVCDLRLKARSEYLLHRVSVQPFKAVLLLHKEPEIDTPFKYCMYGH